MLTEKKKKTKHNCKKYIIFFTQIIVLGIPEKYNHMGLFGDFVCFTSAGACFIKQVYQISQV